MDLYSFGLVAANFAVFFGFVYFVQVSPGLAAICLVLYGLGLVAAGFAVLSGFMYSVLASAALAAFCLVLFGFWLSASFAVLLVSRASRWSRLLSTNTAQD